MAANGRKKELQTEYSGREVTGGVYLIRNTANNRILINAATDLQSSKNRFDFAQKTGSCIDMKLQKDWSEYGSATFAFEVLDELKKGETQTDAEFKSDISLLKEIWQEKMSSENLY